jgi:hypothetical protein
MLTSEIRGTPTSAVPFVAVNDRRERDNICAGRSTGASMHSRVEPPVVMTSSTTKKSFAFADGKTAAKLHLAVLTLGPDESNIESLRDR